MIRHESVIAKWRFSSGAGQEPIRHATPTSDHGRAVVAPRKLARKIAVCTSVAFACLCASLDAFATTAAPPFCEAQTVANAAQQIADGDVAGATETIDQVSEQIEGNARIPDEHKRAISGTLNRWREYINGPRTGAAGDIRLRTATNDLASDIATLLNEPLTFDRKKSFATLSLINDQMFAAMPEEAFDNWQPEQQLWATDADKWDSREFNGTQITPDRLMAGHNAMRATVWFRVDALGDAVLEESPAVALAAKMELREVPVDGGESIIEPTGRIEYGGPGINTKLHAGRSITDQISQHYYHTQGVTQAEIFQAAGANSITSEWNIVDPTKYANWAEDRWVNDFPPNAAIAAPTSLQAEVKARFISAIEQRNTEEATRSGGVRQYHKYRSQGAGQPGLHAEFMAVNQLDLRHTGADTIQPIAVHTFGEGGSFNNCASCSTIMRGWVHSTTGGGPYARTNFNRL